MYIHPIKCFVSFVIFFGVFFSFFFFDVFVWFVLFSLFNYYFLVSFPFIFYFLLYCVISLSRDSWVHRAGFYVLYR